MGLDFGYAPEDHTDEVSMQLPTLESAVNPWNWEGPRRLGPGALTYTDSVRLTAVASQQAFLRELAALDDGAALLAQLTATTVEAIRAQAAHEIDKLYDALVADDDAREAINDSPLVIEILRVDRARSQQQR